MNSERWLARIVRGAPLTAGLLRGLEECVDRGSRLLDESRGVTHFDLDRSLQATVSPGQLQLAVRDLTGVAAGSHTVVLEGDETLCATLPLQHSTVDFDLAIRVNGEAASSRFEADVTEARGWVEGSGAEAGGPKYELVAQPMLADPRGIAGQTLDLGRYRWEGGERVRLLRRPALVRLSSLRPVDPDWLAPLLNKLVAVARQWLSRDVRIATLADELCYRWPILTVREVAQRLVEMAHRAVGEFPGRDERVDALLRPFGANWPAADALPARLADLIDVVTVATEQASQLRVGHELLELSHDPHSGICTAPLAVALKAGALSVDWQEPVASTVVCLRVTQQRQSLFVDTSAQQPWAFQIPAVPAGSVLQVQSPVFRKAHLPDFTLVYRPSPIL